MQQREHDVESGTAHRVAVQRHKVTLTGTQLYRRAVAIGNLALLQQRGVTILEKPLPRPGDPGKDHFILIGINCLVHRPRGDYRHLMLGGLTAEQQQDSSLTHAGGVQTL